MVLPTPPGPHVRISSDERITSSSDATGLSASLRFSRLIVDLLIGPDERIGKYFEVVG